MRSTLSASLTLSLCPVSVSKLRIQRFESSCSTSVSTWRTMVGQHGHGFWMNMQFLSPLVIGLELHGHHWNAYGTLYIYIYIYAFREVDKLDRSIGNTYPWSVPCEWIRYHVLDDLFIQSIYPFTYLSTYLSTHPCYICIYCFNYMFILTKLSI